MKLREHNSIVQIAKRGIAVLSVIMLSFSMLPLQAFATTYDVYAPNWGAAFNEFKNASNNTDANNYYRFNDMRVYDSALKGLFSYVIPTSTQIIGAPANYLDIQVELFELMDTYLVRPLYLPVNDPTDTNEKYDYPGYWQNFVTTYEHYTRPGYAYDDYAKVYVYWWDPVDAAENYIEYDSGSGSLMIKSTDGSIYQVHKFIFDWNTTSPDSFTAVHSVISGASSNQIMNRNYTSGDYVIDSRVFFDWGTKIKKYGTTDYYYVDQYYMHEAYSQSFIPDITCDPDQEEDGAAAGNAIIKIPAGYMALFEGNNQLSFGVNHEFFLKAYSLASFDRNQTWVTSGQYCLISNEGIPRTNLVFSDSDMVEFQGVQWSVRGRNSLGITNYVENKRYYNPDPETEIGIFNLSFDPLKFDALNPKFNDYITVEIPKQRFSVTLYKLDTDVFGNTTVDEDTSFGTDVDGNPIDNNGDPVTDLPGQEIGGTDDNDGLFAPITGAIGKIKDLISGFITSFTNLFMPAGDAIGDMIDGGSEFMSLVKDMFTWLPAELSAVILSGLILMVIIGVLKMLL